MFRTMHLVLGVAACVLVLQAAATSAKDQVERPFRGKATVMWVINVLDGSATGHEEGVATHLGRFTNDSIAAWDLSGEMPVLVSASGVSTAANGDQSFWKITPDQPGIVQVTGGTGRFENATGSIQAVLPFENVSVVPDPQTRTVTITITYKAIGTITY